MNIDEDHQLTGAVIGAAIAVHRALGPGVDEAAYEAALSQKLGALGIPHECQKALPVIYKGVRLDCGYRLDVLVESRLPLELKAVETVLPIHDAQLLTYMRLGGHSLGLLLNFEVAVLKDGLRRKALSQPRPPGESTPSAHDESDQVVAELLRAAVEVCRALGRGLLRSAYEECLCHELRMRGVPFARRHSVPLRFEDRELGHAAELPLLLAERVPVFCLSVAALTPLHEARLLARLRQTQLACGFLINFNAPTLSQGIRRLTLK